MEERSSACIRMHKISPETHSIEAAVPITDLLFHRNPKAHIHKEDPQEEVPTVFLSS